MPVDLGKIMQYHPYLSLVTKELDGSIEPNEILLLQSWIQSSPDNQRMADELRLAWSESASYAVPSFEHVDVNASFERLMNRIKTEEEYQPKFWAVVSNNKFRALAAGVALLIASLWGYQYFYNDTALITAQADVENMQVSLPDGSQVWLRKNAILQYTSDFAEKRKVALTGSAYFQVTPNASNKFSVQMDNGSMVEVIGTEFSIASSEARTEIIVTSGKVTLSPDGKLQGKTVQAGDKAIYDKANNKILISKGIESNEIAWHNGTLSFDDQPLNALVKGIKSQFGVDILIENKDLLTCDYTTTVFQKDIEGAMKNIEFIFQANVQKTSDSVYVVKGGYCPN